MRFLRRSALLSFVCLLGPSTDVSAAPLSLASVLLQAPHITQKPDFCGEACAAMWLAQLGRKGDQDWVFDQSGLDPLLGRGTYARELAQALRRIGFRTGVGWYSVDAEDGGALALLFGDLHADLVRGVPSIVCMHYDQSPNATEHFRLVLGYDNRTDEVIYHEPARAGAQGGAYQRMGRARFLSLWPLKYEPRHWTVIRFRLEGDPESVRDGEAARTPTAADYAQHVQALRRRLPPGFSLALAPPFLVMGDGGAEAVRRSAQSTVAWAVAHLKALYFSRDPDDILDIWLFKDARSYRKHTRELFGEEPDTPYGYYSSRHHALVMNIATGGGTLVHEIVHPYMQANFPEAPAWLNEGLGSLYEQSAERDGQIVGLTNWRLQGLQQAIRARRLPSFHTLLHESDEQFYDGPHSDTSYGQARYLLYYLQERGLLGDFYRRYHAARQEDPSGYRTVQQVLGVKDMSAFQREWEMWVLRLAVAG